MFNTKKDASEGSGIKEGEKNEDIFPYESCAKKGGD